MGTYCEGVWEHTGNVDDYTNYEEALNQLQMK